ncbi:MAG: cell division protein ZapA [Deltaproteobacteria bacterium]|nr:MAG: cell division protein ZapA [Deltaproteobacteria bacterium]
MVARGKQPSAARARGDGCRTRCHPGPDRTPDRGRLIGPSPGGGRVKQTVQVTILGQQYSVRSDDDPEKVARVADFVNRRLTDLASRAPTADTHQVTVLALLNLAGEYLERVENQGGVDPNRIEKVIERLEQAVQVDGQEQA